MPLPKIGLEAVLEMAGFNKGLAKYKKGMGEMDKSTSEGAKLLDGLGISSDTAKHAFNTLAPIVGGIGLAVGGATAAFAAMNKAMEFGKEGATIDQTRKSFDGLMASMGASPTTLQDMSDATLGTVDDMTLMSSTMTLLAGTSDELGRAMVDAAPQLLQIAKAANKLNPTLGDTSFLYQSLAQGIKRSSPMILDNLGLTIKVGEAQSAFAAKLGKTVQALSAEEKQMALLEATIEAGDRMIQQAGGNVEAMGDSFVSAEVALKNLTDEMKADAYPALVDMFEGITDLVGAASEAYATFKQLNTIIVSLQYAKNALMTFRDPVEAFNKSFKEQTGIVDANRVAYEKWAKEGVEPWVEREREAEAALWDLSDAQYEASITAKDLEKAQQALDKAVENVRKSYEGFLGTLAKGIIDYRDLGKAQAKTAEEYEQSLKDLNKSAAQSLQDVRENFQASLPERTTVQERMGMAGDAWDEWGLRIRDIIQNGVASPWYAVLQEMGYSKPPDVGMAEWAQDLEDQFYAGRLPDLLPPEWAENVRQQQQEATAAVQAENAKRLAEVEKARQAELEAERQARNEATIELALSIAEQTGILQAWSQQTFGPDFSQVADSADEVLGLLKSGMLEIDDDLQGIIENAVAGVQQSLDTTGGLAEETQKKLDTIASTDWVQQKKDQLDDAFDMNRLEAPWTSTMATLGELVPKTPFDPMFWNFEDSKEKILQQSGIMELGLIDDFGTIELEWAATVAEQVKTWDRGMSDVEDAIQEKVIEKLKEIPSKIVVTIKTEQETGGEEGRQHGGPVTAGTPYLVGERGPEMFIPDRPGIVLPHEWTRALPAMGGASTTVGPTVNLTMNPVINSRMDMAEFQALTVQTVQQAIRGV